MTKSDAIRHMLDGKKVRQTTWAPETYLCFDGNSFIGIDGIGRNLNTYPSASHWELYEEPAPKTKYYRRKWVMSGDLLITSGAWSKSKEGFDRHYSVPTRSDEWEETEI